MHSCHISLFRNQIRSFVVGPAPALEPSETRTWSPPRHLAEPGTGGYRTPARRGRDIVSRHQCLCFLLRCRHAETSCPPECKWCRPLGPSLWSNDWQADETGCTAHMVNPLSRLRIVSRSCKEDIRHEGLRVAVIERKPARLDLHHDPMAGQEHVVGGRQGEAIARGVFGGIGSDVSKLSR